MSHFTRKPSTGQHIENAASVGCCDSDQSRRTPMNHEVLTWTGLRSPYCVVSPRDMLTGQLQLIFGLGVNTRLGAVVERTKNTTSVVRCLTKLQE